MIKVGMMIAERYEIIEKIGTGGMSDVYRAKDHKLNRFVAVKVLKQEFSENTDFVSKFRTEAQAAAGLMHPNIVNVYDVGEESGFHYIVMELVEGITLKKYIEKKARLSVKEAVSIAIQVGMGIESAHNNHIIHRDIKPQNIIISKEGKVKVTDFGIAKAATSNTITSNVMGSVHYTSPEQVRGGFSDEKSDIYSLGITLFEMLTGRVPFNGDTTVAVAIKHIQEPMPSPREFVPEIPISVEQITLKCTQKSPDKRYQSAPELIEDLKRSLISPDEDFVKIDDSPASGATKTFSNEELASIKSRSHKRDQFEASMATGKMKGASQKVATEDKAQYEEPAYEETYDDQYEDDYQEEEQYQDDYQYEEEYKEAPRPKKQSSSKSSSKNRSQSRPASKSSSSSRSPKKKSSKEDDYDPKVEAITTILVVIAAVIIGCIMLVVAVKALGINFDFFGSKPKSNVTTSQNAVSDDGSGQQGQAQGYQSGTVTVPSVIGIGKAEAVAQIEGSALKVEYEYANSDSVEKDKIINQKPEAGAKVAIDTTVVITISIGEQIEQIDMPDLSGLTKDQVKEALSVAGFTIEDSNFTEEYSDSVDEGKVISQKPTKGMKVNTSSDVSIVLSKGMEPGTFALSNYTVNAPGDYTAGTAANITLIGKDGSNQGSIDTTLPYTVNKGGMYMIPSGTLVVTYTSTDGSPKTTNIPVNFTREAE